MKTSARYLALLSALAVAGCALIPGLAPSRGAIPGLQKIAVIPFAYTDGTYTRACDLCPDPVAMRPTSRADAELTTAFFYEALTTHPRFLVSDPRRLDRLIEVPMVDGLELFTTIDEVDAVLIGALVELRERKGSTFKPERPAGVAVYAALIDARTGAKLWSGTFDEYESSSGRLRRMYYSLRYGGTRRWESARSFIQTGAAELVESMVARVASS